MAETNLTGIAAFKTKFTSVRPTLFRVSISEPATPFEIKQYFSGKVSDFYIYCKAATLPASTVNEIEVGFMGRKFYEHGDREFDPWELTVYNSQEFATRSFFEAWMDQMNLHQRNKQTKSGSAMGGYFNGGDSTDYYGYQADLTIDQLDRRNNVLYTYKMVGAFPTKCGEIQVDYTQTNTIEEFPVTLRYQYWYSVGKFPGGNVTDGDSGTTPATP